MANPWPPGQTPYITPDQLLANTWPTGVDFSTLPPGRTATPAQKTSTLAMVAASATTEADGYCNQPLRATVCTETLHGPDFRVTVQNGSRNGRVLLQRGPVLAVTNVQVAANGVFPRQWTVVPSGFWEPEYPVMGLYGSQAPSGAGQGGQAILVAPPYISRCYGRNGFVVQVTYVAGWPHTSLTANATSASPQTITVDDCTAWAPLATGGKGAAGVIYDAANGTQEPITCTASSATSGPGTLTLASMLLFSHTTGVMVSAFPADIIWAGALYAAGAALTRGATATVIQTQPGRGASSTRHLSHKERAECLLEPYRRVI